MKIGYARVSKEEQSLDLQLDALNKYGCDIIYEDKMSGSKTSRPELDKCLASLKAGDSLVVWKFDRLGRVTYHLTKLIHDLAAQNVTFISLTQNFDSSTATGKLMLSVMAAISEYERDVLIERINAGIKAAQDRGVHCGTKFKLTAEQVTELCQAHAGGVPLQELATLHAISIPTIYRYLKRPKRD